MSKPTCSACPEFHQFKSDEDYGYCPLGEGVVRGDDPACEDGLVFINIEQGEPDGN